MHKLSPSLTQRLNAHATIIKTILISILVLVAVFFMVPVFLLVDDAASLVGAIFSLFCFGFIISRIARM